MKYLLAFIGLFFQFSVFAEIKPQDFAHGISIQPSPQNSLQQFELPLSVYQGISSQDLGDMRIFNAEQEQVNYQLKAAGAKEQRQQQSLAFFPIFANKISSQAINLEFARADDGSIIVKKQAAEPGEQLSAYLIDTHTIKDKPLEKLIFSWQASAKTWINPLKIRASDDLQHWVELPFNASLAQLNYNENHILQNTVKLDKLPYNYLLISSNKPLDFKLEQVEIITINEQLTHQWYEVAELRKIATENGYEFESPYGLPVSALEIQFPQQAFLAKIAIYSRSQQSMAWQLQAQANVYALQVNGITLNEKRLAFAPNRDRYWLIKLINSSNDSPKLPKVSLGWQADKLFFIADKDVSYTLAYGSKRVPGYQKADILAGIKAEQSSGQAKLGKPFILGGDKALKPQPKQFDYKTLSLWVVLSLGLIIVLLMVLSLWRQMR